MIIVATGAGMLVSVLAAYAAVKAQVVQPLLAKIIEEVIAAMRTDAERWDTAADAASVSAQMASNNAEQIDYIRSTVDEIRDQVTVNSGGSLKDRVIQIGERGDKRHADLDQAIERIEQHLAIQDKRHVKWHEENSPTS